PGDVGAFMAGGNIDGGPGSYLIRLDPSSNGVSATQIDFDFAAASGDGELSAMEASPLDYNRWYAATTNGRFFSSNEAGYTWEQTLNFIPEGHYLYGQTIYASTQSVDKVYLGGSGYSNPPVYVSTDGGQNFSEMSEGLPSTLVFEIAGTPDEAYLFAATEAGPYVFVSEEERWYYLGGECAPAQTYWSVEYLPESNTARFGTYGRGIWDFELAPAVAQSDQPISTEGLNIAPNPATDQFTANLPEGIWEVQLVNNNGQTVLNQAKASGSVEWVVSNLPGGTYYFIAKSTEGDIRRQPVLIQ
ncbi:MAG: T9SS type A sorting domain-containing protein, partial [Phaeodactylibacter sp.]|nr:T9SS type A sorting domain-containing protein [Phaeodactylibacter sp.]